MALDANIRGSSTGNGQEVDSSNNARVILPGYNSLGVSVGGGDVNGACTFNEIDNGAIYGTRTVLSAEVDDDYRNRVAHDNWLDEETFADVAQNTSKFLHNFTTLTATESTSGLLTNSGNITTLNTGMTFGTFAQFPVLGTQTLVAETTAAFTAQPNANQVIDFGMFQRGGSTPFLPLDGVYFRMSSTGMQGVINVNGVETSTSVFPNALGTGTFIYTSNQVYKWLIQTNNVKTTFWINNVKYGEIVNPAGAGGPCLSRALPWSLRHAIGNGAAGTATQMLVKGYRIMLRGPMYADSLGTVGNRVYGSYQGLSGQTMGQLIAGTVTTGTLVKPTAAVPLNTSLAANLPNSLGGRIYEALTSGLAVNVDGIFTQYQVPVGSLSVPGRRLRVNGIKLSATVQTAVTGGGSTCEFYIAFGNTSASMATAESGSFVTGTTKAPRRVLLPELTQTITAAQAVDTKVNQVQTFATFVNPIYVNPGEYIQLIGNKTATTATTAGVIAHMYQFDYSWE